jgi:hypothetical protein
VLGGVVPPLSLGALPLAAGFGEFSPFEIVIVEAPEKLCGDV